MKPSTAILLAGASLAAVGVARFVQEARHQRQRNAAVTAGHQIDWLSRVSTDEKLATVWAPPGMDVHTYQVHMAANRGLCQLSLRHRLGLVSKYQLAFYARELMEKGANRRYWDEFGPLREEEALGNRTEERFTRAMSLAAHGGGL